MSALTPERLAEPCKVTAGAFCMTHWSRTEPRATACDLSEALREVERLRAGIEALHRPVSPIFSWRDGLRFEEPCPDCHGKAGVHPCGCWADEDAQYECLECIKPAGGARTRRHIPWPCETAALLNPTEGEADE